MTEIGTQIDSDRRLLAFKDYENYLDSLITFVDLGYLGNLNVAREIAELGYRCTGETLSREAFYKRVKAVKDLFFPLYRPYELTSELITPANPVMQELALRERLNSERLEKENWVPYFEGKKKIWPRASDLAYYHWRTGKTCINETSNYQPIIDPKHGLLFKNCHDRHLINVNPEASSPGVCTTRIRIFCLQYEHVILYDHIIRSKS
ncbi:cilia- and flagella-associated protein 299-like isoform X2 [Osmia lignaria lignaria]|uniref:cilia- and flagella-associated protein 299-like isoform X2 n=1 Tax=Osmia lignaria lignaria TaxID=1437193 RepID=UPI00402B880B